MYFTQLLLKVIDPIPSGSYIVHENLFVKDLTVLQSTIFAIELVQTKKNKLKTSV